MPTFRPLLTLGLAALTALTACDAEPPSPSEDAELHERSLTAEPNILLIIMDDIGVDKVQSYQNDFAGYNPSHMPATPTLSDLSDAGVRFTNAWANPACSPTRAATYTGRHGFRTGVGAPGNTLPTSETILADVLHTNVATPYEVGLFGKWHLGDNGIINEADILDPNTPTPSGDHRQLHPIEHGYDMFAGELDGTVESYWGWVHSQQEKKGPWTTAASGVFAVEQEVDDLISWVSGISGPWFATMAFQAPHSLKDPNTGQWGWFEYPGATSLGACFPITNHPMGSGLWANSLTDPQKYKANVECLDLYLEDMLAGLDDIGALDNTLIVVVGDNGTEGTFEESIFAAGAGAKSSGYEDGIHVPLLVTDGAAWAELVAGDVPSDGLVTGPNRAFSGLVHVVDLFATLTDVAGGYQTTGTDSQSFAAVLLDPLLETHRDYNYAEQFMGNTGVASIRNANFKLIINKTGASYSAEMYEIGTNLRETGTELLANPPGPFVTPICVNLWSELQSLHASQGSTWLSGAPSPC